MAAARLQLVELGQSQAMYILLPNSAMSRSTLLREKPTVISSDRNRAELYSIVAYF